MVGFLLIGFPAEFKMKRFVYVFTLSMSSLASSVVLPEKATPMLRSGADLSSLLTAYITNAVAAEVTSSNTRKDGIMYFRTRLKSRNQRALYNMCPRGR